MRSVAQSITDAITSGASNRSTARLTIYKSRVFFKTDDVTNIYLSFEQTGDNDGDPLPEAICQDPQTGSTYSIFVQGGLLKILQYGETEATSLGLAASSHCRPGVYHNIVYYHSGSEWRYAVVNLDHNTLFEDNAWTGAAGIPVGACHALSATECVIFYIDEGGVRIAVVGESAVVATSPGRIFDPVAALTTDDYAQLQYSTALLLGTSVFAYFTRYDGAVTGIRFDINGSGIWSDYFIALPEDMSTFAISNSMVIGDRVFICGRFTRREQFSSDAVYTLLCWSDDGMTFSLDRSALITLTDRRYMACFNGDILFSSTGATYSTDAPYPLVGEDADSLVLEINSISGSPQSGWNAQLTSGKEQYFTNEYMREGTFCRLDIGISTANGIEWVKYHDCILSAVAKGWEDGLRQMEIQLMPDGLWHTGIMTHPYYMEFQGKQYLQSPLNQLDVLYDQSENMGQIWPLTVDFWDPADTTGWTWKEHSGIGTTTDHFSQDLLDSSMLVDYPQFGTDEHYYVFLYGWSRAGKITEMPNVTDPTTYPSDNDQFYVAMVVEDLDGVDHTIYSVDGELVTFNPEWTGWYSAPGGGGWSGPEGWFPLPGFSQPAFPMPPFIHAGHSNPEQTWFGGNSNHDVLADGNYPVAYYMANPGAGWKIKKLGIKVKCRADNSTYYLERVEMPGIHARYTPQDESTGLTIQLRSGSLTQYELISETKGIPQFLFASMPSSAWNFDLTTRCLVGSDYSFAGLLGLAQDQFNYVIGYLRTGYIGIAVVRDGLKVPIAEQAQSSIVKDTEYDIRFWHRDGEFGVEYKVSSSPTWPVRSSMLTYSWTEDDGPLTYFTPVPTSELVDGSVDPVGSYVFHTGLWSLIDPPKFRTQGFKGDSTIIPIMPLDVNPATGISDWMGAFPDHGSLSFGDDTWEYGADLNYVNNTVMGIAMGPFQMRGIQDWNSYNTDRYDDYTYNGKTAAEISNFLWLASRTYHDAYKGAIMCTNSGYAWEIDKTFFKAYIKINGEVAFERELMRVYAKDNIIPEPASTALTEKVWLTRGMELVVKKAKKKKKKTVKQLMIDAANKELVVPEGAFIYLDNSDYVTFRGFKGASGEEDNTVERLLDKVSRISGTQAVFPGDFTIASDVINGTPEDLQ